jgi:hypothetical protein
VSRTRGARRVCAGVRSHPSARKAVTCPSKRRGKQKVGGPSALVVVTTRWPRFCKGLAGLLVKCSPASKLSLPCVPGGVPYRHRRSRSEKLRHPKRPETRSLVWQLLFASKVKFASVGVHGACIATRADACIAKCMHRKHRSSLQEDRRGVRPAHGHMRMRARIPLGMDWGWTMEMGLLRAGSKPKMPKGPNQGTYRIPHAGLGSGYSRGLSCGVATR